MKKKKVIEFFGGKQVDVAKALGITKQAVGRWGDDLSITVQGRIIATAVRNGFIKKLLREFPEIRGAAT